MKGFFITGTDTGVGKTFVTATLARYLRGKGQRVFAFKPVETGCERDRSLGPDQEQLLEAAGGWQTEALCGLYQLRSPIAPLVAAQAEGKSIDLDLIVKTAIEGASKADISLVEGAGGWRVPLAESADIGALAARLLLPVIVVARATLGTINHSLLTIEAIERDGCSIAAVVLSRRPEESLEFARNNAKQIQRAWQGRVLILDSEPQVFDSFV